MIIDELQQSKGREANEDGKRRPTAELSDSHMRIEAVRVDVDVRFCDVLTIGHITGWKSLVHQPTPYDKSERNENRRHESHCTRNERCKRVEKERKKTLVAVLIVGRLVDLDESKTLKARCDEDEDATEGRKEAIKL